MMEIVEKIFSGNRWFGADSIMVVLPIDNLAEVL
jgi:hypothetical protein